MASERKRKKNPRRRRRFAWLFQLLAVVTLAAAITVGVTVFFQVEEVEVVGNRHYTPEELVIASGILKGDNLFTLGRNSIESSMESNLPYLETVEISLKLPDGILITVEEWDAIATVETDTGNWLISVGGKLLEAGENDTILITGLDVLLPKAGSFLALPQEDSEKLSSLLDLLEALEVEDSLDVVSAIDMADSTTVTMDYDDRYQIILPLNSDYSYDLQVLAAAMSYQTQGERGTFDLTQKDYQAVFIPEGLN